MRWPCRSPHEPSRQPAATGKAPAHIAGTSWRMPLPRAADHGTDGGHVVILRAPIDKAGAASSFAGIDLQMIFPLEVFDKGQAVIADHRLGTVLHIVDPRTGWQRPALGIMQNHR